jgi:nucleotide-binding universal stress UspA family protein
MESKGIALVPVDFSEASLGALATARAMTDDVHVVTVLERPEALVGLSGSDDASRESLVREELVRACGAACTHHVRFGNPSAEIVRLAQELGVSLIVIPARGRGQSPVPLGSTVDRVLRMATVPVYLVRA